MSGTLANECGPALTAFMSELEQDILEPRRLILEWSTRNRVETVIQPGMGGTARAAEEVLGYLRGTPNVVAESLRFTVRRA